MTRPELIEKLRALVSEGLSIDDMAKRLNRSYSYLREICGKERIAAVHRPRRNLTVHGDAVIEAIEASYGEIPTRSLAESLGMSRNAVIGLAYRLALCGPKRTPQPAVGIEDLRGCRWIEGEPKPLRPGMYCCQPTLPGSAWCREHYKRVWRRTTVAE